MLRTWFIRLALLALFALLAVPALAQDADPEPDPEEETLVAPGIVAITPDPAVINGAGFIVVTVEYFDEQEDATHFVWRALENDFLYFNLFSGRFSQRVVGTEIPVRFWCYDPPFSATIELTIVDAMGNESLPETFQLICNDPTAAPMGG